MKRKILALILAAGMALSLAACSNGGTESGGEEAGGGEEAAPVELTVFAAASMTETMTQIAELYKEVAPNVTLTYTFDSSGTLKTQIENGADCDLFISAAQKQMNQLDIASDANPDGLDFVLSESRIDLLENKVVLAVAPGSDKGIASFEDIATDKVSLIALGNSDVPVGQYSEEIFTNMGVWDQLNAENKISFGSNVKEVTTWVSEGAADCGVVYGTDAYSAGLTAVAEAPEGMLKTPVIYPAAVMKASTNPEAAQAFLDFLQTDACSAVFEAVGFAIPG